MTTAQILFAASVLAVTALMVWAIRVAQVRESLSAMTAAKRNFRSSEIHRARPTHVVLWACGHVTEARCDPGCQHSDQPWESMLRCGDCAREAS